MATRDPNIISEHFIPTDAGMAVVHEIKGDKGNKYQVMNPAEVPAAFHPQVLDQARKSEEDDHGKPHRKKSI